MNKSKPYFVNHPVCLLCPTGREYFAEDEIKQANVFAQRLANETGKPVARRDIRGGESWFYPAY